MLYVNGDDAETDGDTSKNPNEKTIKPTEAELSLDFFWPKVQEEVKNIQQVDAKNQVLPLARIKKIMKLDEDAKMIAAEAPLLFAKAAEIFIQELTLRAWIHTEENRRRTLQRNDVAKAISKCDQFDFLIDIVPREEVKTTTERKEAEPAKPATPYSQDQVQYYVQLAQQHQQALQNTPGTVNIINTAGTAGNHAGAAGASVLAAPQNILLTTGNAGTTATTTGQTTVMNSLQSPHQQIQLLQQVVTPSGDITHVPVTISQSHLNLLRMQMQNNAQHQQVLTMQAQQPSLVQVSAGQQNPGVSNTATGGIFLNTTQATISDDKRTNLVNSFRPNC